MIMEPVNERIVALVPMRHSSERVVGKTTECSTANHCFTTSFKPC